MTQTIPIGKHEIATPRAFDGATPPVDITATGAFVVSSSNTAAVTAHIHIHESIGIGK